MCHLQLTGGCGSVSGSTVEAGLVPQVEERVKTATIQKNIRAAILESALENQLNKSRKCTSMFRARAMLHRESPVQ